MRSEYEGSSDDCLLRVVLGNYSVITSQSPKSVTNRFSFSLSFRRIPHVCTVISFIFNNFQGLISAPLKTLVFFINPQFYILHSTFLILHPFPAFAVYRVCTVISFIFNNFQGLISAPLKTLVFFINPQFYILHF